MVMKKVISGGQTGVDRVGLEVAHELGIPTGGVALLGFRTESGPDLELKTKFGLTESHSSAYPPRTRDNVLGSDGTVLFGDLSSPGCRLTIRLCQQEERPFIINPDATRLRQWIIFYRVEVLNVAGNRLRTNPKASETARLVLTEVLKNE